MMSNWHDSSKLLAGKSLLPIYATAAIGDNVIIVTGYSYTKSECILY